MKNESKQKLIKMLSAIIKEIKLVNSCGDHPHNFFICLDSVYANDVKEHLPELVEFGKNYLLEFKGDYAFSYGKGLSGRQYNECKIRHLELYINSLQLKTNSNEQSK